MNLKVLILAILSSLCSQAAWAGVMVRADFGLGDEDYSMHVSEQENDAPRIEHESNEMSAECSTVFSLSSSISIVQPFAALDGSSVSSRIFLRPIQLWSDAPWDVLLRPA